MIANWQHRLDELIAEFEVPGTAWAVYHNQVTYEGAAGLLSIATGVAATPDALFEIGSITKAWTATQVMLLESRGLLALDTPVIEMLPGFKVSDAHASEVVTARHLLAHTSGIEGDLFLDTGRDGGCIARYIDACAGLPQIFPPEAGHSYCNAGYVILGGLIEHLTGQTWDGALHAQIIEPLCLMHTCALPREARYFKTAAGHLAGAAGGPLRPAPMRGFGRSIGPAGLIWARAADVVAFGSAHLPGGKFAFPQMREAQVAVPNPHSSGEFWGLGWILDTWSDRQILRHYGATPGQSSVLCVVPSTGTVVCALANRGNGRAFLNRVLTELLEQLCGVEVPPPLAPPAIPLTVDPSRFVGTYGRSGITFTVAARDSALRARIQAAVSRSGLSPAMEIRLVAVGPTTFVGQSAGERDWTPYAFYTLADGTLAVHFSVRTMPKLKSA